MQATLINPFLHSIQDVMSTMANMEATPDKPSLKSGNASRGDITGLIGLTGGKIKGSLAISFPESVILDITQRILGEKPLKINDTVTDMVGEITNIVTGGAKRALSEQGYDFDLAIPGIITGPNHRISHTTSGQTILLPFSTTCGKFFVEISFCS